MLEAGAGSEVNTWMLSNMMYRSPAMSSGEWSLLCFFKANGDFEVILQAVTISGIYFLTGFRWPNGGAMVVRR